MRGKEHLTFGIMTGATATLTLMNTVPFVKENPIMFFGLTCLGSLLPDIDYPGSTLGKQVKILSTYINKHFGHRTITHDIGILFIIAIISFILNPVTLGLWIGIYGHIFLDSLTIKGVPIFGHTIHLLPKFLRFKSDSIFATITVIAFCVILWNI